MQKKNHLYRINSNKLVHTRLNFRTSCRRRQFSLIMGTYTNKNKPPGTHSSITVSRVKNKPHWYFHDRGLRAASSYLPQVKYIWKVSKVNSFRCINVVLVVVFVFRLCGLFYGLVYLPMKNNCLYKCVISIYMVYC